ncbi:MAG: hypothetical protein CVU57_20565 [Deltaproteobacteria bacterium HGW-Deltaproteobacteria-15]|nr:MAG: hypothetical protein CVU57_20565 [Deltaproteobacteria bacterium HGW-Deltaproteobacteria-15]
MDTDAARILQRKVGSVRQMSERAGWLPPWLFKHHNLMHALEDAKTVSRDSLTNLLNHAHFTDGIVLVLLQDTRFEESILVRAHPEPSLGQTLFCRWAEPERFDHGFEHYSVLYLILDDGRSMILLPAELEGMSKEGISIVLPTSGYAVGQRRSRRYSCQGIDAELIQSGFVAKGNLVDFSPRGFRLHVKPQASCSFRWFNQSEPFTVHLNYDGQMVFSGACRHVRSNFSNGDGEVVVCPSQEIFRRFKNKQIRNTRQKLVPSPTLSFMHPLLRRRVFMQVENISSSGFSVREKTEDRMLIPGMMIPELVVTFAGALNIKCSAQVIYQMEEEEGVRCGLAILDMGIQAYSLLTHILTSAIDSNAYISSEVDMDALWEFFFTAGFIYPKKYRLIQSYRDEFRKTYEKLYLENPEIARHFTYQSNGRIYGHISMVRAYERAWMIHHHAAQSMNSKRTGFMVLKQIMHYLNDMHRLPSANMDYVMSYFRPENAFPDRVFGGFARELNNPKGCSTDLFCYLPYTAHSVTTQLPEEWSLEECSPFHMWEFSRVYDHVSGGLLLDGLGLMRGGGDQPGDEHLSQVYEKVGLRRAWQTFSLTYQGALKAILLCNHSDLGFNLSELLNGMTVLVADQEGLPWNVLSTAISILGGRYRTDKVPVLSFPVDYVKERGIPYEKLYQLWILNVQYGNEYLEYMQKKFRISYR